MNYSYMAMYRHLFMGAYKIHSIFRESIFKLTIRAICVRFSVTWSWRLEIQWFKHYLAIPSMLTGASHTYAFEFIFLGLTTCLFELHPILYRLCYSGSRVNCRLNAAHYNLVWSSANRRAHFGKQPSALTSTPMGNLVWNQCRRTCRKLHGNNMQMTRDI